MASKIKFTNLDKIYYPDIGVAKGQVIDYYRSIAKFILPYLKDRPVTLKRYPEGIEGPEIYQRHLKESIDVPFLKTQKIYVSDKAGVRDFIMCQNISSLIYLTQLGTIEYHPWYSIIDDSGGTLPAKFTTNDALQKSVLNYPNLLVFDLDPPAKKFSEDMIETALAAKKLLDKLKLISYVKTSGKSGLHIYLPLKRLYTYERVRRFACGIGEQLIKNKVKITLETRISKRGNLTFFDCSQNALSKSLVSAYSLRAAPRAAVSFPVAWANLRTVRPGDYTIKNVPALLKRYGDPWQNLLTGPKNSILP